AVPRPHARFRVHRAFGGRALPRRRQGFPDLRRRVGSTSWGRPRTSGDPAVFEAARAGLSRDAGLIVSRREAGTSSADAARAVVPTTLLARPSTAACPPADSTTRGTGSAVPVGRRQG